MSNIFCLAISKLSIAFMKKYIFLGIMALLVCVAVIGQLSAQGNNNPVISAVDGQNFCLTGNTFELNVQINQNGYEGTINFYEIIWGDGSKKDTIPFAPGIIIRKHIYNFDEFFNTCNATQELTVRLNAYIPEDSRPLNNAFFPVFKNPPIAKFEFNQNVVCVGDETCFRNTSCPSENLEIVSWDYGDGSPRDLEGCHTYTQSGNYPVTLTVKNGCGSPKSITNNITIIEPPQAEAQPISGIINGTSDPFIVCLDDSSPVILNASNSQSATSYEWTPRSQNGINWLSNRRNARDTLRFTRAGDYTITLTVNNACDKPSMKILNFKVVDAVKLTLDEQADACEMLSYTPRPFIQDAIYTINGQTVSNFPTMLTSGVYRVEATLSNECGPQTRQDNFEVRRLETFTILSSDTTLCAGSSPIQLQADVAGGIWRGNGITNDTLGIFDPSQVTPDRTYSITYGFEAGACSSQASIDIQVIASQTASIQDEIICTDSQPIQLEVNTNIGGVWRGAGIIDSINGTFSPSGLSTDEDYKVTFTFTDPNSCEVTTDGQVLVEAFPTLSLLDSVQLCLSDVELDLPTVLNYLPTPSGGSSRWRGDGIVNATGKFNSVSNNLAEGFHTIFVAYERNNCTVTDSVVVELIQARPLVLSPDTTVCVSAGQLQLEANLTGGTWRPSNNINSMGLIDLAQLGGGNFMFNYEYQIGTSCEQSAQVNVEVIDLGATVNAGQDTSVCQSSGTIAFTGTPAMNGSWSNNDAMNSTTGVVNVNELAPDTYEYRYQIESEAVAGCVAEDRVNLTIHALPSTAFEIEGNLCVNTNLQFNNQSTGATSYRWDVGIGNSNEANPTFSFPTSGDYNVQLFAFTNTAPQCSSSVNQMIRISEPPPAVGFNMDKREGCADLEVAFTNTSQGEDITVNWDFGNGVSSSAIQPTNVIYEQGRVDTLYYIQIVAGNNCGDRSFRDSVLVHPRPVARLGTDKAKYCSGDTVSLINASFGQPDRYSWTYGNGQVSNDSIPIRPIYYTDSLSRNYLITLFTENECGMDTDSFNIRIDPTNVRAFFRIDSTEFCAGDSIRLESFSTPFSRLLWNFGDGNSSANPQPSYAYNNPGIYQISHYAFGCGSDSTVQQITIKPLPEPAFDIMGSRCVGDTIRLTNRSNNAVSFAWNFGDGTNSNFSQAMHRYSMNGDYNIALTATAENRCSASLTQPITIRALPIFQIDAPDSICANALTQITVTANELFSSYNWQLGDGELANGRLVNHSYLMSDTYTLSALITDAFGCKSSQETSIFVRPTPTAAFSYELLGDCPPINAFFTNESQTANGFEWKFSDNFNATTVDVARFFERGGSLTAELIASLDGICFDTTAQSLSINATPEADLVVEDISCFGQNDGYIEIQNNTDFRVEVFGDNYAQAGRNLFEALKPGNYEVIIVSKEGCDTSYSAQIREPDALIVDIVKDTIFTFRGEVVDIRVDANATGLTYTWFPDSIAFSGNENDFTGSPRLSGWYDLTASDGICTVFDSVFFLVEQTPPIYISTHFSPNGDSNNDIFYPQTGPSVERVEQLQIFERWGDMVFAAYDFPPNDPNFGWDGTLKGVPLNPAVFVFKMQFRLKDSSVIIQVGEITLVR